MSLVEAEPQGDTVINLQEKMGVLSRLLGLSPLGSKVDSQNESPPSKKEQDSMQTYYGVYIPCESKIGPDEEILHVYKDKNDALKVVKKYKKARFKAFKSHHDAVAFSLQGIEPSLDKDVNQSTDALEIGNSQSNFVGGEKPSQFKVPKPQDMVLFRKTIETGNFEAVKKSVWDNPRYLVSSGDTPAILHEGSRYNALHVAVKSKNVQMCDFILSTVSDPQFVQLLYGDDNIDSCKDRASILLDLYLNTPDKAINETPLHFAVKFGAKDIVDLLVSYPQCNKNRTNKFGGQPKDIICQRCESNPNLINEISSMLEERFYVPVLHSEDDTKQPIIGDPFSPGSPPSLNPDPISPRMEIRAFAGPMNKNEAHTFRKKWKTPPRSLTNSISKSHLAEARFRLQDVEKGLEKVGRNLAQQLKIGWKEYWPFLDTFTDLTSIEGLGLLEDYLKNKFTAQWNSSSNESFTESLQMTPKTPNEKIKDFPKFGDNTPDVLEKSPVKSSNALSPMSDLCVALKSLNMNENVLKNSPNFNKFRKSDIKSTLAAQEEDLVVNNYLNPGLNPYFCVEKSCQVFAKRLGLGFSHALTAENEMIVEYLKTEMKHLQQTVASYTDDHRFHSVNFRLLHSRVAQLVAQKLKCDNQFVDDLDVLVKELTTIAGLNIKNGDSFSSDEEDAVSLYRHGIFPFKNDKNRKKNVNNDINTQIKCIATNILKWIEDKTTNAPMNSLKSEEECFVAWACLDTCSCSWQTDQFLRTSRRNASFKRNQIKNKDENDILSSSPKLALEMVSKRLLFEEEADDNLNENLSNAKYDNKEKTSDSNSDNELLDSEEIFKDVCPLNNEDFEPDVFHTPFSSNQNSDDDISDYEDADDGTNADGEVQAIYVFIHGDKPTKTDKSVYDAISNCDIDVTKYPYVYRWRHTVSLYTPKERESWLAPHSSPDELDSPITCSFNIGYMPSYESSTPNHNKVSNIYTVSVDGTTIPNSTKKNGSVINPITLLTPIKNNNVLKISSWISPKPSMQDSKWMRITGPNSPRSAIINKNYGPNISLGF